MSIYSSLWPLLLSFFLSNHLRITEKDPSQTGKQLLSGDEKRTEIGIRRMAERADRVKKEVTTWLTWLMLTWKPTLLYLPAWAFFCAGPKARTHSQTIAYNILRNYTLQSYCRNTEKDVSEIYETTECSWYRGTCFKVLVLASSMSLTFADRSIVDSFSKLDHNLKPAVEFFLRKD